MKNYNDILATNVDDVKSVDNFCEWLYEVKEFASEKNDSELKKLAEDGIFFLMNEKRRDATRIKILALAKFMAKKEQRGNDE